jgi:hypothetical protein
MEKTFSAYLPISPQVLLEELSSIKKILEKWEADVQSGIPVVELEAPAEHYTWFIRQLCGELELCASRLHNLGASLLDVI